ncbi:hypothetical protein SEPCBS119000_003426 [Sporothrix epigloea]|uniref:HFB protein n=1 Tax=Sporothrix epigloea TaxID=1892477 RepID=A0ABP0DLJ1_9PEZI
MRFATLLVGAFAAFATAQSSNTTTGTAVSSASWATSSAQAAIDKCLNACAADDLSCRAKCIAVPDPSAAQANATNKCVAGCSQGNGTASANLAYADCVSACIGANYFTSTGTPAEATGAAGSSVPATLTTATKTDTKTGSSTDKTGTASGTGSGATASATASKSAGVSLRVATSAFALLGFATAVLAL